VTAAAPDHQLRVLASKFAGVGAGVGVRRVVVALQGDGGHSDGREVGEPPLQVVILRFACGAEPASSSYDHDRDVIRIVEGSGAARRRGVAEGNFELNAFRKPPHAHDAVPFIVC